MKGTYLIAIDPSTTSTGVSVFKRQKKSWKLENTSLLSDDSKRSKSKKLTKAQAKKLRIEVMKSRVRGMIANLYDIFDKYNPIAVIVEDSYSGKDPMAYKMLCRLQGAIWGYALSHGDIILFKPPSEWRRDIGFPQVDENGKHYQRDDFKQIAVDYIKEKYGITIKDDIAEAVCLGLSSTEQVDEILKGDYEK
jgi:Holliday junction resolvasome RuvABC endonuclease subunit